MCFKHGPGCGCCGAGYPEYRIFNLGGEGDKDILTRQSKPGANINEPQQCTWAPGGDGPWWFEAEDEAETLSSIHSDHEYVWVLSHGLGDPQTDFRIYRIPQIWKASEESTDGQIVRYSKLDVTMPIANPNPAFSGATPFRTANPNSMAFSIESASNNFVLIKEFSGTFSHTRRSNFYYHLVGSDSTELLSVSATHCWIDTDDIPYIQNVQDKWPTRQLSFEPLIPIGGENTYFANEIWHPWLLRLVYQHQDIIPYPQPPVNITFEENRPEYDGGTPVALHDTTGVATWVGLEMERGWRIMEATLSSNSKITWSTVEEEIYTTPQFMVSQSAYQSPENETLGIPGNALTVNHTHPFYDQQIFPPDPETWGDILSAEISPSDGTATDFHRVPETLVTRMYSWNADKPVVFMSRMPSYPSELNPVGNVVHWVSFQSQNPYPYDDTEQIRYGFGFPDIIAEPDIYTEDRYKLSDGSIDEPGRWKYANEPLGASAFSEFGSPEGFHVATYLKSDQVHWGFVIISEEGEVTELTGEFPAALENTFDLDFLSVLNYVTNWTIQPIVQFDDRHLYEFLDEPPQIVSDDSSTIRFLNQVLDAARYKASESQVVLPGVTSGKTKVWTFDDLNVKRVVV